MNQKNLKRFIYHEIGHFMARELNYELYGIGEGVESIFIKTHNLNGSTEYSGGTVPKKPKGYDDKLIINVKETAAVILYGCLFQTLYFNFILPEHEHVSFRLCFSLKNGANGSIDMSDFSGMSKYISGEKRKKIVEYTESKYINLLLSDKVHLEKLFNFDILDTLNKKQDSVDLEILKVKLSDFKNEHKKYYSKFIETIDKIIKER